ncbi:MAG: hypothetical protein J6V65_05585 [Fibrobacterales bacterium]|nr:hypothetical protein [Fibrobacterales bacterium]
MSNYIGKWYWIKHPEHIPDEEQRRYYDPGHGWAVLVCVAEQGDLLDLQMEDGYRIQAKIEDLEPRPTPAFLKGDRVRIVSKDRVVNVEGAYWHFKDERYFYHLVDENGKMMKKRYFAEELQKEEAKP